MSIIRQYNHSLRKLQQFSSNLAQRYVSGDCVYLLRNYHLQEAYLFVTSEPTREYLKKLQAENPTILAHWDRKNHDIEWSLMKKIIFSPLASLEFEILEGRFERECPDWKILRRAIDPPSTDPPA